MSAVYMEDPFSSTGRSSSASPRLAATRRNGDLLEECVNEFTRRLRACVALPDDDEHFWARVVADIDALKARCQPQDAFAFELKAARVLAEYGFTTWPETLRSSAHPDTVPADAPAPVPVVIGQDAAGAGRRHPLNRAS